MTVPRKILRTNKEKVGGGWRIRCSKNEVIFQGRSSPDFGEEDRFASVEENCTVGSCEGAPY